MDLHPQPCVSLSETLFSLLLTAVNSCCTNHAVHVLPLALVRPSVRAQQPCPITVDWSRGGGVIPGVCPVGCNLHRRRGSSGSG